MDALHQPARRPRGRPPIRTDDETRGLIAEAARRAFMTSGFAGTSMDDVAQAAGVSKKTLYRLVPNKGDLFQSSVTDRIARFMLAVDPVALDELPVAIALGRIMEEYGLLTLSPETVAIQKLVIAESDRFPDLAVSFFQEAITATQEALTAYLRRQCERGTLKLVDPGMAAGMLRGMMTMEPQRAAMMGKRPLPNESQIAERARCCVQVFLFGAKAQIRAGDVQVAEQS